MKTWLVAALTLLLGFMAGMWKPQGEVVRLQAELDKRKAAEKQPCRSSPTDGIRTLLQGSAGLPQGKGKKPIPEAPEGTETPSETTTEADAPPLENPPSSMTPEQVQKEMDEALRPALEARRAQALQALKEQANLDDEGLADVEDIMKHMNDELGEVLDDFVEVTAQGGQITRRGGMEMASGVLDVILAADDKMRDLLPEATYQKLDPEAVDPLSFVSYEAVSQLQKVVGMPVEGEE